MKYSEFKKAVEGLSKHYYVEDNGMFTCVKFKGQTILVIPRKYQYTITKSTRMFKDKVYTFSDRVPYSHKVWMLACELSMTPVEDRREHRWNVIVGRNTAYPYGYSAYAKSEAQSGKFIIYRGAKIGDLKLEYFSLSDDEFDNLITQLKEKTDGDRLAKIAELGKVPAPEAEK